MDLIKNDDLYRAVPCQGTLQGRVGYKGLMLYIINSTHLNQALSNIIYDFDPATFQLVASEQGDQGQQLLPPTFGAGEQCSPKVCRCDRLAVIII